MKLPYYLLSFDELQTFILCQKGTGNNVQQTRGTRVLLWTCLVFHILGQNKINISSEDNIHVTYTQQRTPYYFENTMEYDYKFKS